MNSLIRISIERPIAVISAVLMTVMFGLVALDTIPIQLTPDIDRPVISVRTSWAGAAPAEIEREITNRQEDVLKGLPGLLSIDSTSGTGSARITLEFILGTNMDKAMLLVANRLDRVNGYPDEANEPTLSLTGSEDRPIAWFIITRQADNKRPIHQYGDFLEDVVQDRFERVDGVSEARVRGGTEREIQVTVQPELLARYHLRVSDVITALRTANITATAGNLDEGKRSYVVRTQGELNTVDAVRNVVVRADAVAASGRIGRVVIGDIADTTFSFKDTNAHIRQLGHAALAVSITRETGANVIETMTGIRKAAKALNDGPMRNAGLQMVQVYDETVYINSAVDLVQQNIWFGGSLAALILLLFLRSWRATLIVSLAIPVSVVGSFVAMAMLGRSLNVISLAGLAFAVGMVVDAAIVVLENIYRLREKGQSPFKAAYEGTRQVWGAVFVSALTTVAVFIPILIMQLEVGQLFRDIAVAISVSVFLSLIVSITVLPALASRLLTQPLAQDKTSSRFFIPGIDHLAAGFVAMIIGYVGLMLKSRILALSVVALVSCTAILSVWAFLPKMEYLPNGNRNLLFGVLSPPPGYNLKTMNEIAQRFENGTKPYWVESQTSSGVKPDIPLIKRFFFVATANRTFIGAAANDPARAGQLVDPLNRLIGKDPDVRGRVNQSSLFGRGLGTTRQIDLDISGPKLKQVFEIAAQAEIIAGRVFPRDEGNTVFPDQELSFGAPEIRVLPNRRALADANVSALDLAQSIDTFNDGMRVAEVTSGSERIDLMLKGRVKNINKTQDIAQLPVVTPTGQIVPVSSLAKVELTSGPVRIKHKERLRTVTLQITPRNDIPLETALQMTREQVMEKMTADGLPDGVQMHLSGTADKLGQTWSAMQGELLIAMVIVYLVMAVLFESFLYPMIIMLSVPLAAAGGVAGLTLLNLYVPQQLDMLTLLGFVILIGIVVNNAILLVHQTLVHMREENLEAKDAIMAATSNRIRPIFMSTLTSIVGMLPLVVMPGAGSELYRGLGSVVVGGLSLSAILTLLVIPPMMALVVGPVEARSKARNAAREHRHGETANLVE